MCNLCKKNRAASNDGEFALGISIRSINDLSKSVMREVLQQKLSKHSCRILLYVFPL
jgi:hypothetical protein